MRLTGLVGPAVEARLHPLTLTRSVGECYVAGETLRFWQERAWVEAGVDLEKESGWKIAENVWIDGQVLGRLVTEGVAEVKDGRGSRIAWREGAEGSEARVREGEEAVVIRYPWDFLQLQEILLGKEEGSRLAGTARVHERATVAGQLILGEDSEILPGVYIEGVAVIGKGCRVGPNAYLRGKTMIGDGCHIGQAVEIKNSIIYPRTAIGHLSYCGDSVVGEGVNFGAGTITSNFRHDGANHRSMVEGELVDTGRRKFGAILGDGVHTGIHTGIYPGRKLWPGTSTLPGEMVRKDVMPAEGEGGEAFKEA